MPKKPTGRAKEKYSFRVTEKMNRWFNAQISMQDKSKSDYFKEIINNYVDEITSEKYSSIELLEEKVSELKDMTYPQKCEYVISFRITKRTNTNIRLFICKFNELSIAENIKAICFLYYKK